MAKATGRRLALAGLAFLVVAACAGCTDPGIVLKPHDLDIPLCADRTPIHVEDLAAQVQQHCNPADIPLIFPDGFTTGIGGTGGPSVSVLGDRVLYGTDNYARFGVAAYMVTDHGKKVQWWGPKHALELHWKEQGKHPQIQ